MLSKDSLSCQPGGEGSREQAGEHCAFTSHKTFYFHIKNFLAHKNYQNDSRELPLHSCFIVADVSWSVFCSYN